MGGVLESFREGTFVSDVARLGGDAIKIKGLAGYPDRLCWLPKANGEIVWFWGEWKRDEKEPVKPHQAAKHDELRKKGHLVYVFRSNKEARLIMRGLIGAI